MNAQEMWRDVVSKQPIDDMHIKMICDDIGQITGKKSVSGRMLRVLTEAKCIILRQQMEIKATKGRGGAQG